MNRQNSRSSQASNLRAKVVNDSDMEPKVMVKCDRDDYYEGETVHGTVRIKFAKEIKNFTLRISVIYQEGYVLFNETGETALLSKEFKKKLVS